MKVCGIVSEYNPFHNGHMLHIERTRELIGESCAIMCCMSGNFVQRGEAAIMPKHLRAEAAVRCGADLVFELPARYALLSAEGFAAAAVYILASTGVLTDLSFGAEHDNIADLIEVAQVLLEHNTVLRTLHELKSGVSYAAARERALYAQIKEKAALISSPNNILAVEYLKALISMSLLGDVTPHAVSRIGAGHDSGETEDNVASASHIRALLRGGNVDALRFMPQSGGDMLRRAMASGLALVDSARLEAAMHSALMWATPQSLAALPGVSEGLEHRLYKAIHSCRGIDNISAAAKTRRYPHARIRRLLMCAFLGITKDDTASPPPYAKVLAMNERGRQVLHMARDRAMTPIITKPAHVKKLSARAVTMFEHETLASEVYSLALPGWNSVGSMQDWRTDAVYINT